MRGVLERPRRTRIDATGRGDRRSPATVRGRPPDAGRAVNHRCV